MNVFCVFLIFFKQEKEKIYDLVFSNQFFYWTWTISCHMFPFDYIESLKSFLDYQIKKILKNYNWRKILVYIWKFSWNKLYYYILTFFGWVTSQTCPKVHLISLRYPQHKISGVYLTCSTIRTLRISDIIWQDVLSYVEFSFFYRFINLWSDFTSYSFSKILM